MKTTSGIFIALFIVTTGIFGWLYLNERASQKNQQEAYNQYKADAEKWRFLAKSGEKYINSCVNFTNKVNEFLEAHNASAKKITTNPFTNPARALEYINEFMKDTTYLSNNNCQGAGATTSIWIDFGIISELARMYAPPNSNNIDGVRLYFAKYPRHTSVAAEQRDPIRTAHVADNGNYDKKYSLVLVATQANGIDSRGNRIHKNFFQPRTVPTALNTLEGLYNYHDLCPNGSFPPCQTFTAIP